MVSAFDARRELIDDRAARPQQRTGRVARRHAGRRSRQVAPCSTWSRRWSNGRPSTSAASRTHFLEVPQECLILTMRTNQKYFPLFDREGRLLPRFLIVSNMDDRRILRPSSTATSGSSGRAWRMPASSSTRTARLRLADRVPRLARGGLPRPARQPGRRARSGSSALAGTHRRSARPRSGAGQARRAAGQGRPADRHGRRVPGTAGHHGPLLRAARRRAAGGGAGDCRALPAALRRRRPCRPATPAARSPWPTSSRRSRASGASASGRPARRIRSRCGATRWASIRMLVEQSLPLELGWLDRARPSQPFGRLPPLRERRRAACTASSATACAATCASAASARPTSRRCSPWMRSGSTAPSQRLAALAEFRQLPEFEALAAANKRIANILRKSDAPAAAARRRRCGRNCWRSRPKPPCTRRSWRSSPVVDSQPAAARLRRGAEGAGRPARAGGRLLRHGDGQCAGAAAARQPARPAARSPPPDEPGGGSLQTMNRRRRPRCRQPDRRLW